MTVVIICSDNGFSPVRRRAIMSAHAETLQGTYFHGVFFFKFQVFFKENALENIAKMTACSPDFKVLTVIYTLSQNYLGAIIASIFKIESIYIDTLYCLSELIAVLESRCNNS